MNIKIDRKIYNTETAQLVAETAQGAYGDSTGFAEKLYKRGPGDYFLYGHGGEQSPYPQPGLFVLTLEDAKSWMNRVAGEEFTNQELGIVKGSTKKAAAKKAAPAEKVEVVVEKAEKKAPKAPKAVAEKAPKAPKAAAEKKAETPKAPKAPKAAAEKKVTKTKK